MDRDALVPVGAFVIMSFLLFGLIVMGCMMYWNWSHRKQSSADIGDNISNGNACIYEKNNPRTYNRSTSLIITANAHGFSGSDVENGWIDRSKAVAVA